MAITATGKIAGSVSGGCVEGAVVEAAAEVIKSGRPRLLRFGVADDTAWAVGLACGGHIEVFVTTLDARLFEPLRSALEGERSAAMATVVGGAGASLGRAVLLSDDGTTRGSLGETVDGPALPSAREALADGRCRRLSLGDADVFVEAFPPSPTLVVVGGVHIAVALTTLAKALGYRAIVVDPRRAFGNEERFPHADRLVSGWPDEALGKIGLTTQTAVAVLTHDPKLDDPALRVALPSPAFYVGALGSRKTQEKRRARLLEAGITEEHLARLHAPIGLDLGGRSPAEIALAVMGQVVAARNGRPTR
jgi:xanthine dehydrogenase accessory factor